MSDYLDLIARLGRQFHLLFLSFSRAKKLLFPWSNIWTYIYIQCYWVELF